MPYWNWAADKTAGRLETSDVWNAVGDRTGPVTIKGVRWTRMRTVIVPLLDLVIPYNSDTRVTREFAAGFIQYVDDTQDAKDPITNATREYDVEPWNASSPTQQSFRNEVEGGGWRFHDIVHRLVGGDMGRDRIAPNDPLFFLHHAMVDRLWSKWQSARYALGGELDDHYHPTMSEAMGIQLGHRIDEPMLPWSDAREWTVGTSLAKTSLRAWFSTIAASV